MLLMPVSSSKPLNLSSPREAKRPDKASCSTERMCTFQCLLLVNAGRLMADLSRLHSTIGGFKDTELKLFAVMPTGSPFSARVVIMVTPVVNVLSAERNSCGSKLALAMVRHLFYSCYVGCKYRGGAKVKHRLNGLSDLSV